MEDRRFFDLRKLDIAEPVHQHRDKEHRDNDDVTRTQCMTDFLLKEQHQDDEEHAQKEQAHREFGSLRQRLFQLFLARHRNKTFLHTLLEDRILGKIHALERRNQRGNSSAEQTAGKITIKASPKDTPIFSTTTYIAAVAAEIGEAEMAI